MENNRYKYLIFDCDGVLVDSETITSKVFITMASEFGVSMTLEEFNEEFLGVSLLSCIQTLENRYELKFPTDFLGKYKQKSYLCLQENLKPIEHVIDVLNEITLPYCVASNSDQDKVTKMLELTDLYKFFRGKIFSSDLVRKPKPAPDIYLHIAKYFNVEVKNCIVVEDTPSGVTAAKLAGMTVVGYCAQSSRDKLIKAGANHLINDMREILQYIKGNYQNE